LKKGFVLRLLAILIISTLVFTGCSVGGKNTNEKSNTLNSSNTSTMKDGKSITDNDLMNSANEDAPTQLDSVGDQTNQLSSDEIDLLLNDNININFEGAN